MPRRTIRTCRLPEDASIESFRDSVVVVIDVLRATSTITTAMVNGAARVIPCETIESALAQHQKLDGDGLLCGERKGARIDGFDLGNSPREFSPQSIGGRTLICTTTNGTRAMLHARLADEILLGCFLNLSCLLGILETRTNIQIICSGTNRVRTLEDELLAGAIVDHFASSDSEHQGASDSVAESWRSILGVDRKPENLFESLKLGQGGINLMKRGFEHDIRFCSQIDLLDSVCRFDPNAGEVQLSYPKLGGNRLSSSNSKPAAAE